MLEPWIETYTGEKFWFLDPKPEMIDIADIAHALSNICRFTGHCSLFYSVAEHSILMSRYVESTLSAKDALLALMHDAAEAYLGDISKPLKDQLPQYKEIEERVERVIAEKFGLQYPHPDWLKKADHSILKDEKQEIMGPEEWVGVLDNTFELGVRINCWPPEVAKKKFLQQFEHLAARMSSNG